MTRHLWKVYRRFDTFMAVHRTGATLIEDDSDNCSLYYDNCAYTYEGDILKGIGLLSVKDGIDPSVLDPYMACGAIKAITPIQMHAEYVGDICIEDLKVLYNTVGLSTEVIENAMRSQVV